MNQGMFSVNYFAFALDGGFVGTQGGERVYARKASNGTLIFEDAAPQTQVNKSYVSVSNPDLVGQGYIYCKLPQQ